jgi:hypothetical protein
MSDQPRRRWRWRLVVSCLLLASFISAVSLVGSNDTDPHFGGTDLGIVLSIGCFLIFLFALLLETIFNSRD